jgi:hypothetical protein
MSCECHEGGPLHAEALQRHCCEDGLTAMARERVAETVVDHYPAGTPRANRTTASALAGELTGRTVGWKTLASSPRGRRLSRVVIRQVDTASKRLFARWHLTLRSGAPKQILNQGPGEAQQARLP